MSKVNITILETNFEVEFDFKITAPSYGGSGPSFLSPGEPPKPCEYEIEVLTLYRAGYSEPLDLPAWLKEVLEEELQQNDAVYEIVAESEHDSYVEDERED